MSSISNLELASVSDLRVLRGQLRMWKRDKAPKLLKLGTVEALCGVAERQELLRKVEALLGQGLGL